MGESNVRNEKRLNTRVLKKLAGKTVGGEIRLLSMFYMDGRI